ncbi:DNA polymerase III subunit gamma and tau, partial [uncultured Demequina sp.]|uniref:DNA polymerase III subunit gamma and tau n=1 Tax=uncultured Demequina sp. TaxID=693499 RepID=UPI0025FF0EE6
MSTALYRRYRPDSFADVVGQEHVTAPLMQALRADRVNHAYLFSGPRGCGKTTSARILARCLNCEQGPTDTPCGECQSCAELARGGAGSVDVVEIDAASHNGVDDARELRERAAFAPARDRYKIFILDEAHMVTPQGFNALLKLVEEPPPHIRFIFATTEPEKVIGTIRSRTHHYPFRLVPPAVLTDYLGTLCEAESVEVESGVLPLVVRAGGGSVRDSLSVLDQLMAGSDAAGVTYERAIALLGFTDATLLDDAVDAIAVGDGASLFDVVGRVIGTGHEPRRFVEDLLERLRDLILLATAGPDGVRALGEVPADQLDRMKDQARRLGLARASQAGDLVNDALTHMVGATSPRLHLELLCARLVAAATGAVPSAAPAPSAGPGATAPSAPAAGAPTSPAEGAQRARDASAPQATPEPEAAPEPVRAPTGDVASGAEDAELVRRRWPEVLGTLERRRVTWSMVSQSAQVAGVEAGVLTLAFDNAALASRFTGSAHAENVALAVRETLGLHVRVDAIEGPGGPR